MVKRIDTEQPRQNLSNLTPLTDAELDEVCGGSQKLGAKDGVHDRKGTPKPEIIVINTPDGRTTVQPGGPGPDEGGRQG
jgi:hypothetical protein